MICHNNLTNKYFLPIQTYSKLQLLQIGQILIFFQTTKPSLLKGSHLDEKSTSWCFSAKFISSKLLYFRNPYEFVYIYLKERGERERLREWDWFPICWFTSQMPGTAWTGLGESQEPGLSLHCPGTQAPSHHLLFQGLNSQKAEIKGRIQTQVWMPKPVSLLPCQMPIPQ